MPRKPSATSSSGSSSEVLAGPSATISTRSPSSASSCARSSMSIRPASSSSSSTPSRRTRVQDQTSASGDPFRHARLSTSVAWKPRAASKGTSCLRGSSGPAASPASLAPSTTATSVPRLLPDDEPGEGSPRRRTGGCRRVLSSGSRAPSRPSRPHHYLQPQPVLGESARLVHAGDIDAPQGLHSGQPAHERVT
jgi:hypothetical protein